MFWIVLSIGPESFLEAHPNASNFELKSPTTGPSEQPRHFLAYQYFYLQKIH